MFLRLGEWCVFSHDPVSSCAPRAYLLPRRRTLSRAEVRTLTYTHTCLPPLRRDVVNKHLAPLLFLAKENPNDRQLYTFAKLFTQLTFPPDKDHPFDTRNDMYRYLQAHKRACLREGVMSAFMGVLIEPLEHAAQEETNSKDIEKIELMLTLFINLFKLPSKTDALRGALNFSEAQMLQRELVSAAHRERLLDTILYITQNIKTCESLNLKVLEVWCAIVHGRNPTRLAWTEEPQTAGRALADKKEEERRVRFTAMAAKRESKQGAIYSSKTSRHGRWGGALKVVRCVGGGANIMGGTMLKDALYDDALPKIAVIDKSRGSAVTDATETDATIAQDWELAQVLKKLMACGCNELVQSTRESIFGTTTNAALRLTADDADDWMSFLRFSIAFHLEAETRREHDEKENKPEDETEEESASKRAGFEVTPVSDAVCPQAFHTVLKMCMTMMEEKNWSVLTAAMGALHQMFAAVQRLCVDTSNTKNRNVGKQIYTHIFSDHAYLRMFPAVLKAYDGKKHQRELLISAVQTADIVLTMLEEVADEGWVTTKKVKVKVKVDKRTPEGTLADQVHERVETRVERREKVMQLDFVDHVKKEYGTSQVVKQYAELLKDYQLNTPAVTDCVASFLELVVERCAMTPMLFQLSVFCLFSELLNAKKPEAIPHWDVHGARLQRLATIVLTDFFKEFDKDPGIAGRLIFWSRKGDVKSMQDVQLKKGVTMDIQQVGGGYVSSDDEDEEDEDDDILSTVRRRLGRFKKKKRPWQKQDGEKLVLLYGRWRGLPERTRAELIASDYADRSAEDIMRQIAKLKLDTGAADKKKKRKKIVVGDDEEEEVKDAALMIHVEKCLARLRKSLSPATIANNMYATALEFLAAQLTSAATSKTDEVHSIVPTNQEEWRILFAKWLQQTMLILGLKPPNPAEGSNFWHVPAACTRETLEEAAELVIRVMKQGEVFFDEDEDLAAAADKTQRDSDDEDEVRENPGARPGAFDEAAAEYAAEQAGGGAGGARTGELDELDMLEQRLKGRKETVDHDSSSDDDDAGELMAQMQQGEADGDDGGSEAATAGAERSVRKKKEKSKKPSKEDKKKEAAAAKASAAAAVEELRQARAAKQVKEAAAAAAEAPSAEEDDAAEVELDLEDSPAPTKKRSSGGGGRLAKRKKLRAAAPAEDSDDDLGLGEDDDGLDLGGSSPAAVAAPAENRAVGRRAAMMMSSTYKHLRSR